MVNTCERKGLQVLGTGDIMQPDWLKYMEENLEKNGKGMYTYKDIYFVLQSELEDEENIHHIVFFPDFSVVREVQKKLDPYSSNIRGEWGGRPRVNLSPPQLADIIIENGGLIGPAHAFTPFKAIFRQNRYKSLEECYQDASHKIHFLELGLSANTDLADRLKALNEVTFLSNSDAHSQKSYSLGREFNQFYIEEPSFEEIQLALERKDGRKISLNVGLHPKLGKYYNMFCNKCRRRILFKKSKNDLGINFSKYSVTDNFIIFYESNPDIARNTYIQQVATKKMVCPACKEKTGKNIKIKLGVSERIDSISSYKEPKHPTHRPPYINAIPLIDIIRSIKGIKSKNSKTVVKAYNGIVDNLGTEYEILLDLPVETIKRCNKEIGGVIEGFRNDAIEYIPGGGGTYGNFKFDAE